MYGKKVIGIERSTFLIDETGTLKKIFRKVKVDGHIQDVINALK
jgi:peroxiredoxin Q/BCP